MKHNAIKSLLALLLLAFAHKSWAAEAAASIDMVNHYELSQVMQLVLGATVAIIAGAVIYLVLNTLNLSNEMLLKSLAEEKGITLPKASSENSVSAWLEKIQFQLFGTGAVEIEKEADIMLAHGHDGIFELDNRLPPWWVSMFYLTIFFSVGYIFYYHFLHTDKGQLAEYKTAMEAGELLKAQVAERQANLVNEKNVVSLFDEKALADGARIFTNNCAACHGNAGEGGVGPNMTDEYWLHGGGIKNVFAVIKHGVPAKGMIAWQSQISASDIQKVASYILTLQGTNPPNPKAPQGEIYKPEDDAEDGLSDSSSK